MDEVLARHAAIKAAVYFKVSHFHVATILVLVAFGGLTGH